MYFNGNNHEFGNELIAKTRSFVWTKAEYAVSMQSSASLAVYILNNLCYVFGSANFMNAEAAFTTLITSLPRPYNNVEWTQPYLNMATGNFEPSSVMVYPYSGDEGRFQSRQAMTSTGSGGMYLGFVYEIEQTWLQRLDNGEFNSYITAL